MTKIKKITIPIFILSAAAVLFTSCGEGTTDRLTAAEVESIESYVMSSYFMLRGDAELPESRAAWDYTKEVQLPAAGATATTHSMNYPEKGQRTDVEISVQDAANSVYKVENVTTYPKQPKIIETAESYYIKDDGDGYLNKKQSDGTNAVDPISDISGDTSPAITNSRIEFETLYADETIRYEQVTANTYDVAGGNGVKYAAFDIDGDLTFPSGNAFAPTDDSAAASPANFSSMVKYIREDKTELEGWSGSKIIVGSRYYTEHGDASRPTKTSVAYERVYAVDTVPANLEAELANIDGGVYTPAENDDILAETVIRYEITSNGKKTVKTQTVIFNGTTGATTVTFSANYETDDTGDVVLNSGIPVAAF